MPNPNDLKTVETALAEFQNRPIRDAAAHLLSALGYSSERSLQVNDSSPEEFLSLFGVDHKFDRAKALFADWKSADFLFQLTDQELSRQSSLFAETSVNKNNDRSYVFIAIELKDKEYARGKLSAITRQINRIFPMPVMVLFQYEKHLSIAVINRRTNKQDENRDVLGKVTLIREIDYAAPHRGHLDILASLMLANLVHPQKKPIADFDTLHAAWEQIFNIDLLNQRFYRELANWYFWALPQVDFPADLEPDSDKRRATGLIRLLTRLIFCWFLKEKGLIPEKLFHKTDLETILTDFDDNGSGYYQAILQNLFFATLNHRMGNATDGQPYRAFAYDEGFQKNRATYDVNNLYRYEKLFRSPDSALSLFEDIPFLNGGLFECLDRAEEGTNKKLYLDGFSRNSGKRPKVPNKLFFGDEETVNLSDTYGDAKRKSEKVTGLINILNRYKFTIVENTPIDQEIALDPELLGKVFENLLASYNEETKTTARKQTGSFYTPRPIVEYMVDESLKAHLSRTLVENAGMKVEDANAGLEILFAYTEKEHAFTPNEVDRLIAAIDAMKILDPACGSGAFPMGVLHKLVYILGKLDPENDGWKNTQLAKLDSAPMREELERAFTDNNDDYGRKLYLIENCLYGVDIQPIAIQITKLRFFISLICDQKSNTNVNSNLGIRPLPNLETKFVSANTLIGLPKLEQTTLFNPEINEIEKKIETYYHNHFSIQRRNQKLDLQRKIKALRKDLALILADEISIEKSTLIAGWDPFDPQSSADFFDPQWMFGRALVSGFDVIMGNPPYGASFSQDQKNQFLRLYHHQDYQLDSYLLFLERVFDFLAHNAIVAFIIPNTWLINLKLIKIRNFILTQKTIHQIVHYSRKVFDAVVDTDVVLITNNIYQKNKIDIKIVLDENTVVINPFNQDYWASLKGKPINILSNPRQQKLAMKIQESSILLDEICNVAAGMSPYEVGKGIPRQTKADLLSRIYDATSKKDDTYRPLLRGSDIDRYSTKWDGKRWIKYGVNLAAPRKSETFDAPEKIVIRQTGDSLVATLDDKKFVCMKNTHTIVPNKNSIELRFILGLLNSCLLNFYFQWLNPEKGEALAEVKKEHVAKLPIKKPSTVQNNAIVSIVNQILYAKENNLYVDTSMWEQEIDQLVYALYELTPEEIVIVEDATK